MPELLIELLSEEIPARMQTRAAQDFQRLMSDGLVEAGLTYAHARAFVTPRRLCLVIEDLLAASPQTREERKGPRADAPDKAIEGFLRSTGLRRDQLEARTTPRGEVLFAVMEKPGRPAQEIIAQVLDHTIRNFPWPKSMRWGDGTLRWVRPLHSILCILSDDVDAQVVPFEIGGIAAGGYTYGHRFMAPDAREVANFEDYQIQLRQAFVVLDAAERADIIWNDASNMAFAQGLELVPDQALLSEVAGLVEWPVVLIGPVGQDFLNLPAEVLQTSMKEHQKFFSAKGPDGQITHFVTVANRETADAGATILAGNEKVLAARLADAAFFWSNDLRVAHAGLQDWLQTLESVTFHSKLGSQGDLIRRMQALAADLAPICGADPQMAINAARLAKVDLASEMVYEFPELQGVMGRYYLEAAGQPAEIAAAAQAHYAPLGPSDDVPRAPVCVAIALAEKLDKLGGFWAIDEKPTGSKDPFALRRAALGVIRLVLENDLTLPLRNFLNAREVMEGLELANVAILNDEAVENLITFFHDRLKVYLRGEGVRHDVIDAALAAPGADDLALLSKRARALQSVIETEDGTNLVQGYKRASNLLVQAEERDGVEYSYGADRKYADCSQEEALFDALDTAEPKITTALSMHDFATAMNVMAQLRTPIDHFFEAVKINADSDVVRRNRLNLLSRIRKVCDQIADLGRIA